MRANFVCHIETNVNFKLHWTITLDWTRLLSRKLNFVFPICLIKVPFLWYCHIYLGMYTGRNSTLKHGACAYLPVQRRCAYATLPIALPPHTESVFVSCPIPLTCNLSLLLTAVMMRDNVLAQVN